MKFRCSYCGHTFTPDLGEQRRAVEDMPPQHPQRLLDVPPEPPPETELSDGVPMESEVTDSFRSMPPPVADTASSLGGESNTPLAGGTLLLKQEGKIYHVRDIATLQRWIVERRVLPEDLVSREGVRWEPVGQQPDFQVFISLVEQVENTEDLTLADERTRPPTPPEDGWAEHEQTPWVGQDEDVVVSDEQAEDSPTDKERNLETARATDEGARMRGDYVSGPRARIDLAYQSADTVPVQAHPIERSAGPSLLSPPTAPPAMSDSPSVRLQSAPPPPRPVSSARGIAAVLAVVVVLAATAIWLYPDRGPAGTTGGDGTAAALPPTAPPSPHVVTAPAVPAVPPSATAAVPPAPTVPPGSPSPTAATSPAALTSVQVAPPTVPAPVATTPTPAAKATASAAPSTRTSTAKTSTAESTPRATRTSTSSTPRTSPGTSGGSTARTLVKKGWDDLARKDYGQARQNFIDAVALGPTDAWAWYGLGYSADKQGDLKVARDSYCKAWNVGQGDLDLVREVEGRLRVLSMSCQ